MRVLFVNLLLARHVLPTLGPGEALIQRGHRVTYVLTPEWQARSKCWPQRAATPAGSRSWKRLCKGV